MAESGIYKITNTENQKIYVGSAVNIKKRWTNHKSNLNKNLSKNKHLQCAWNKSGEEYFVFSILELCEPSKLIEREQYYIDTLQPEYNILKIAGSSLGYKHTPQQLEKMGKEKKGNKNLLGFIFSAESKIKMSESHKGKKPSEETRQKMRDSHGSPEARKKMSEVKKGKKRTLESRLKQSATLLAYYAKIKEVLQKDK